MSDVNAVALRALAETATPGPWHFDTPSDDYDERIILAAKPHPESVRTNAFGVDLASRYVAQTSYDGLSGTTYNSEADGAFIAAANPATVLALLDRLEVAEATVGRVVTLAQRTRVVWNGWPYHHMSAADLRIALGGDV
jgi:hypothetical protein